MRDDPLISYRYLAGGRVVEAQCSSAALRIEAGEAEPLTPEDTAIYEGYRGADAPETVTWTVTGTEAVEEVAPTPEVPPLDPDTDWPAGYTFKRSGAYVAVFDPDGDEVRSTTPSGMWRMEAGRKAAWHDLEA